MTLQRDNARLVLGRYRIAGTVGRGGASQVHRAHDVQTNRDVAVKEIPLDAEMARRAGAEVRAAGRLSHPGVVRLLDFGEDTNACYLVSELVEGSSLAELVRSGWVADHPAGAVRVVADVLDGLAHAHERGVTHRDVKPANILVEQDGRGRLTDFGIARIAGEAGLTATGGVVGTVSYMAPEQARGEETGPAADVYSACLVLYECLTGSNPIVGASPGETLRRAADGSVPQLVTVRPGLPQALCSAIDDGLARDPRQRPAPGWLAKTLRAQTRAITGASAPGRSFAKVPALATAAAAGGAAGFIAQTVVGTPPATTAMAAGVAGLAFGVAPWPAALLAWGVGTAWLALHAPGLAMLAGALGLVALGPLRRRPRLAVVVVCAPILAGLALAPVFAAAAGLVRGWRHRLWIAVTGLAGTLGWQVVAGADPAVDGGRLSGIWPDVEGVVSPLDVVSRVGEPLQARPAIAITAGLLAGAILVMPAVLRLRHGVPRALGVTAWIAALIVGVAALGGDTESAVGAFVPGGILVVVWAAGPWRRLRRSADRRPTVTLRGATVERLPAA